MDSLKWIPRLLKSLKIPSQVVEAINIKLEEAHVFAVVMFCMSASALKAPFCEAGKSACASSAVRGGGVDDSKKRSGLL